MRDRADFRGAKLILFIGDCLIVLQRDDRPDIEWPGYLDFPGGGREGNESPVECVLRETREEVGLDLSQDALTWRQARHAPRGINWFFAAELPALCVKDVHFGNEGTGWALMTPAAYLDAPLAIPHFRTMLSRYLAVRHE